MILVGSQRGGASNLASHLLKDENDFVTLQEVRGFAADDLRGALAEADAVAKGTRCKQPLFSLSLNPPEEMSQEELVKTADRAEEALGLKDQPRAVVIHEKNGRRHAHVVWSRIDAEQMKAINLPFYKTRLKELSHELFLEHGWELPEGHRTNGWRNPLNFTLAEWQQAKRLDLDPREIKQVFRTAWEQSDNLKSFKSALEENGYFLAQGDRRGFVALDTSGEIYSLTRWAGLKTKDVEAKLGQAKALPGVEEVQKHIRSQALAKVREQVRQDRRKKQAELAPLLERHRAMVKIHREEREKLIKGQDKRWQEETKQRSERLRKGFRGLLDRVTGKAAAMRRANEFEAFASYKRDRDQREALYGVQTLERQSLQSAIQKTKTRQRDDRVQAVRRFMTHVRGRETKRKRGFGLEL